MKYLLYSESKIPIIKYLSHISLVPLVKKETSQVQKGALQEQGRLTITLSTGSFKEVASGSGRVARSLPLYPPVSVVAGAPPFPGQDHALRTLPRADPGATVLQCHSDPGSWRSQGPRPGMALGEQGDRAGGSGPQGVLLRAAWGKGLHCLTPQSTALEEPPPWRKRSSRRGPHSLLPSEAALQLCGNFCQPLHPGCWILSRNWLYFIFFKDPQIRRTGLFLFLGSWVTVGQCKALLVFYYLPAFIPYSRSHFTPLLRHPLGSIKRASLQPTLHKSAYVLS